MLDHMLTADAMLLEANMGVLDKLKIVALAKQVKGTVEQERRKKLVGQLTEQLKLAEAALGGVAYQRTKAAWETDADGNRYRVQRPVKLRQWWMVADGGADEIGAVAVEAFVDQQKFAQARPAITTYPAISDAFSKALEPAFYGKVSVADALAAADAAVRKVLP